MSETPPNPAEFVAPSLEELAPLFPAYEIEAFIAQGGMGAVYRATQRSLDRLVAIKILPREFGEDENFRASFEAEAKAMAKLNHPNLIGVYDFGDIDGMLFIVMEFVEGKALYYSVHKKAIDPLVAFEMVSTISRGLAHAHAGGIIHRDIKPANILLDLEANPKIGDFGLARPLDQDRSGGVVFGTPGYTAPEVYKNDHPVDQRSDIFSIGALLYELLSGEPPAADSTGMTIGNDPRIDAILKKATHADPSTRYHDAQDLADSLDKLAPKLSGPRFAAPTHNGPRPIMANPSLASAKKSSFLPLLLILLALAGGGAFAYFAFFNKTKEPHIPVINDSKKKEKDTPKNVVDKTPPKPTASPPKVKPKRPKKDAPKKPEKVVIKETPLQALQRLREDLLAGKRGEFPHFTQKRNGSAYFYTELPVTWHEANKLSSTFGASLALFPNPEALKWARESFKEQSAIWVGASDSGTEGKWHWQDGTAVAPSVWTEGGPDNKTTTSPDGENFAALSESAPLLEDHPASLKLPFILEWKLDGTTPSSLESQLARTAAALNEKRAPIFPAGTANVGGSRFLLVRRAMKWGEASNLAISGGGHLAVMSNEKEMAYTHRLLQGVLKKQKSCWIGGRKNSEDEWENVTRESFDFLNWLPGQPDNFGEGEEFLVIRKMDGQVGANDESGTQEPVNFLLIEWSHPSQRNFSAVAKAPEDEPTALEKAFAEVRMDIINKHGKHYGRFRKKYDDIIDDFVKKSTSEVTNLDDRLTPDQQQFLIAQLKAMEGEYWLPEEIPAKTPKKIKRYFDDSQTDANDLWESYEEDFEEAVRDYSELLDEASRQAFKKGNQVLGLAFKLETASLAEDDILLHKILNGVKVSLPTEKKKEEEKPKEGEKNKAKEKPKKNE